MIVKSSYIGIDNYAQKNRGINKKYIILIMGFISFCIICGIYFIFFNSKSENIKEIKVELKSKEIEKYIDLVDGISKNSYQINWQEVASIYGVLNSGDFNNINEEKINEIAKSFYKQKGEDIYIKTFEEVLEDFNIVNDESDIAKGYLIGIKENVLNDDLKNDYNKKEFIEEIKDDSIKNYNEYGILPSVTIAQAILESGWGKSELASKHNNLFGIKADKRWNGEVTMVKTKENYDDTVSANFRKYSSIEDSISDHGEFLYKNKRYSDAGVFKGKNYMQQAQALEDAGYSTSKDEEGNPIYADKLIRIIRQNNLMLYDSDVIRK